MPLTCMALVLTGLLLQAPVIHFGLSILGISAFFLRGPHPLDRLYTKLSAWLGSKYEIPANPLPRKYACLSSGVFNFIIGIGFIMNYTMLAYICGTLLVSMQLLSITTHFCYASWLYEYFFNFLHLHDAINLEKARKIRMEGALLVDVRTPVEYQKQSLTGSQNIPLYDLKEDTSYHGEKLLIYCRSGLRAKEAVKEINKSGLAEAYNLGGFDNALKL